jgi:phospholipid transport system substrate-binding protein
MPVTLKRIFLIALLKRSNNQMFDMRIYTHAFMKPMAIMTILFALVPHAYADRTQEAEDMVETLIFEIQDIAANVGSDEDIYAQTDDIINRYFKYETLASFTIGPYWRKATDAQKQRFLKTFRAVLVEQAAFNFDYFRTLKYQFQSSEKKGENWILVNGIVHDTTGQYPDAVVSWRISDLAGQQLYIFDLSFENVSMLLTQKDENMAVIRKNKGSLDALIDLLAERSIELKQARLDN